MVPYFRIGTDIMQFLSKTVLKTTFGTSASIIKRMRPTEFMSI